MLTDRIRPFQERLKENGIGLTRGYELVAEGRLVVVKVGRRTYIRDSDWNAFVAALPTVGAPTAAAEAADAA